MTLEFHTGRATYADILSHLQECDASFLPALSSRVDLASYAKKISCSAVTFEAWHGHRLVGLVASYFNDQNSGVGFITSVSTAPDWKGRGAGRALMTMALDYAESHGFMTVNLEVGESNLSALGLYDRLGFVKKGHANGMVSMTWIKTKDGRQMGRSES